MSSAKEEKRKLFIGRKNNGKICSISAMGLLAHTAIIGQSGSGKSFLMGRVIEEILLNTNGKIVIFDINADFIKIHKTQTEIWKDTDDDAFKNLLQEDYILDSSYEDFNNEWKNIAKKIYIFGDIGEERKINISWYELTLKEWCQLLSIDYINQPEIVYLLNYIIEYAKPKWQLNHWKALPKLIVGWARKHFRRLEVNGCYFEENFARNISYKFSIQTIQQLANQLKNAMDFNILNDESEIENKIKRGDFRLLCLNIAFLPEKEARLFAIYHIVKQLWKFSIEKRKISIKEPNKDKRVPIFILIDEAHKIAPEKAENLSEIEALELIKQIASEGRKFGLFLILATQRPQKLHEDILSECDNICIMHLVNSNDFNKIQENFGYIKNNVVKFNEVLKFGRGKGFFAGKWVDNENIMVESIAPQRTEHCGGDLKKEIFEKGSLSEQIIK